MTDRGVIVAAASAALLVPVATLDAQMIRGRVIDGETQAALAGVVVTLLDTAGVRMHGVLSGADGVFVVRADAVGTYRLRAEMIGRKSVDTEPIRVAGEAPFQTIVMPYEPIALTALDVNSARRCSVGREVARATHVVWEEVQKALRSESIAREQALYRFHVAERHRRLDRDAETVLSEETRYSTQINDDPFSTLPAEQLARDGYAHVEDGDTYIYGPSTTVLLSPGFQQTHCFRLRRERGRPGLIGLAFEPVAGREVTDIEGVLWVEEASAELRTLEFRYRNIPSRLLRGDYTGFAEFQRLPGAAFVIRRWWLRSPATATRRRVTSYREESGEVVRVEPIR